MKTVPLKKAHIFVAVFRIFSTPWKFLSYKYPEVFDLAPAAFIDQHIIKPKKYHQNKYKYVEGRCTIDTAEEPSSMGSKTLVWQEINKYYKKENMDETNLHIFDDDNKKGEQVVLPGFRFHPTDEELVGFYLLRKVEKKPLRIELIKQVDIYKYDPWDLPSMIPFPLCSIFPLI